ncbi:MAG: glycosyltransferase family 10 [Pseudomonadota bacterium]
MLVRIIKDWKSPDLMRQTPDCSGIWDTIHFTEEEVEECDFLVVLNRFPKDSTVVCNPANVFAINQEPPLQELQWMRLGYSNFHRVISPEFSFSPKIINDHPSLPWHVGKNYNELRALPCGKKEALISWVTSNVKCFPGHTHRLNFLNAIQNKITFDLWGRGFNPLEDKWQGIAPYKYSFAIENFSCKYYWTEKIADCYLAWTMPIYYGCKNIQAYFPPESMIYIDITHPEKALETIEKAIADNSWEKSLPAIEHARNLILERYQFFPFIHTYISAFYKKGNAVRLNFKELPYGCTSSSRKSPAIFSRMRAKINKGFEHFLNKKSSCL